MGQSIPQIGGERTKYAKVFTLRFEKVNASVGNVYLYKGMGKEFNRGIVDMENPALP